VKAVIYATELGPTIAWLPPAKKGLVPEAAAIPADEKYVTPGYTAMSSQGTKTTWAQHVRLLTQLPHYAGRWYELDVPDGSTARFALNLARNQAAHEELGVSSGQGG
jgi:hypothetical protein